MEFYRRARERERTALELRAQLSRAQLDALQSQLHPHFLFNTLHAASTLMHRDVEGADAMLTQLADLLRATLRRPGAGRLVPCAERVGTWLRISVADDGPGFSGYTPRDDGVGLANTRARLEELYGDDQCLTMEPSSPAGGTGVIIELPFRPASALPSAAAAKA